MILVTGATGYVGRHIIERLMDAGLPVRCLLTERDANRLPWDATAENSPEIVLGTLLDDEAVFRAVTGVHTIIHLESAMWWGSQRSLERVEVVGTRSLIAAARSARVGRIITLSHLGAAPSSAYALHRIKGQVEELVRNSGLAYTVIRSGLVFGPNDAFMSHIAAMLRANPLFFLMPGDGSVVLHPIYIDDLTRIVVDSLENLRVVDQTLEVGGQEYITLRDLLLTLMRVGRMSRLIIPVPPYLMRFLSRVYGVVLPRALVTPQWLDILATNRTTQLNNVYTYFGFQPRRIEDTLVGYLPQEQHLWHLIRNTFRRRPRSI